MKKIASARQLSQEISFFSMDLQIDCFHTEKKISITHDELFKLMSTIERVGNKFFLIYSDVSKGLEPVLRDRKMNICVTDPGF